MAAAVAGPAGAAADAEHRRQPHRRLRRLQPLHAGGGRRGPPPGFHHPDAVRAGDHGARTGSAEAAGRAVPPAAVDRSPPPDAGVRQGRLSFRESGCRAARRRAAGGAAAGGGRAILVRGARGLRGRRLPALARQRGRAVARLPRRDRRLHPRGRPQLLPEAAGRKGRGRPHRAAAGQGDLSGNGGAVGRLTEPVRFVGVIVSFLNSGYRDAIPTDSAGARRRPAGRLRQPHRAGPFRAGADPGPAAGRVEADRRRRQAHPAARRPGPAVRQGRLQRHVRPGRDRRRQAARRAPGLDADDVPAGGDAARRQIVPPAGGRHGRQPGGRAPEAVRRQGRAELRASAAGRDQVHLRRRRAQAVHRGRADAVPAGARGQGQALGAALRRDRGLPARARHRLPAADQGGEGGQSAGRRLVHPLDSGHGGGAGSGEEALRDGFRVAWHVMNPLRG
ncbi:conserved hypothetical protein [Chromobacterium violaceum ATCC 12472]|uniref:Uncharacterized protein n=1 Tax=Chromobacterium violaceum (strain ATCC 12472 / DSM 30191 / JCM 1249 / CCUG 213 / NBRC 12614 / NCIMB 9131 / NCTC 9757 / MK) TaxID=243365 RepID=Q7P1W4_CHRVO|nr:conserved hypothetical protein [Chromobacterium violaceum ATCC 12472]